mmetsp:Transcript_79492/g.155980  ORF Transcript_79492/g.155980 Transcript_79492/m.155980 type:complete len:217 (-) Transcript_79492:283-933(-)
MGAKKHLQNMWWSSAITSASQPNTLRWFAIAKVREYDEKQKAGPNFWFASPLISKSNVPKPESLVKPGTANKLRKRSIGGCQKVQASSSVDFVNASYSRASKYWGFHSVSASPTLMNTRAGSLVTSWSDQRRNASRKAHWVFDDFPAISPGRPRGWYAANMSAKRCPVRRINLSAFSCPASPSRTSMPRTTWMLLRAVAERPMFCRVSSSMSSSSL